MKWWIVGLTALVSGALWQGTSVHADQVMRSTTNVPVTTLDVSTYASTADAEAIQAQSEGLYTYNAHNRIMLGVAKQKPTVNQARTRYTFQLRHTHWSNGDEVTASDFVYAWRRVVDPATGSRNASKLSVIKNAVAITAGKKNVTQLGVKAIGKYTLQITLAAPSQYLPQLLAGRAFGPLDQSYVERVGSKYGTSSKYTVSNGPFTVQNWTGSRDRHWSYVKNSQYWDRKVVKIQQVKIAMIATSAKAAALFDQGKVAYAQLTDRTLQRYIGQKVIHQELTKTAAYLFFNTQQKQLQNVHLRRAIAHSYNKVLLARGVLRDGSSPLNGLIPTGLVKYPVHHRDYRAAEKGVATSKYSLRQSHKEWLLAKKQLHTSNIKLQLLVSNAAGNQNMAEFMQAQLQHNLPGLKVSIKTVTLAQRIKLEEAGHFQMVIGTWTPNSPDPANYVSFFASKSLANVPQYSNRRYDQGLRDLSGCLANRSVARWRKIQQLEKQAIQGATVVAPIYQQGVTYLQKPNVTGLNLSSFGAIVNYKYVRLH